mmetsp:Transcript_9174/g.28118  ORF Transcript_9174/g.28118 Transcript_9174/m.28118 type:complete len:212 (+) Transcript_9174:1-636(+)
MRSRFNIKLWDAKTMVSLRSLLVVVALVGGEAYLRCPTTTRTTRFRRRPQTTLQPQQGSSGVVLLFAPPQKRLEKTRENLLPLRASEEGEEKALPWFVDPGTYGGVLVLTLLGLTVPFVLYAALASLGIDSNRLGVAMSGVFVVGSIILWTLSYVFRVFNKEMTYGTQLKNYEDAVIKKRYEELTDDEVNALVQEVEREEAAEAALKANEF